MKGIILLNGEPYKEKIDDKDAFVICCDGAYKWAKGKVRIDKNVGDFDSLSETPYPPPDEIYPSEKNYTDGEIAIEKLIAMRVGEIEIYGGGGGREDHFLGNLHLLMRAFKKGFFCSLITKNSIIYAGENKIFLGKYKGRTFSLLPFGGNLHIIDFRGVKYDYPSVISYGETRGISNIAETDDAFVETSGCALVIINRGEV